MNYSSVPVRVWCVIVLPFCLFLSFSTAKAQENNSPCNNSVNQTDNAGKDTQPGQNSTEQNAQPNNQSPQDTNSDSMAKKKNNPFHSTKTLIKDLLHDQKEIWLSPLKIQQRDSRWLVPIALTTATLIATDQHVTRRIDGEEDKAEVSSFLSRFGSSYADFGIAGSFYAVGKLTRNERATETGALAIQALINSSIVVTGLKYVTERERPSASKGDGHFFERGSSFPSGHAVSVWALATVIADEYREKPLVRVAAYGVATAVSVARVTGRNHFSSDVFVGSTLGYLIGHYTVKHYGKQQGGRPTPSVSPYVNPHTRTYGLAAGLSF